MVKEDNKPQIFRMMNNCVMVVENGVTKIITDSKLLSKSNEELLKHVINERSGISE